MQMAATALQILIRVCGVLLLILGTLFWTGHAEFLIPLHETIGITLVLALWILAVLAGLSGVNVGFVALAIAWGLVVPILGLTQDRLLPGPAHWLSQVLHLLLGIGAIGQAENLARRMRRTARPAPQM